MFCVAVYEETEANWARLQEILIRCSMSKSVDTDIETLRFTNRDELETGIEKYAGKARLALIHISEGADMIGRRIYEENHDCLICYYADKDTNLLPYLKSRPIAFALLSDSDEKLTETICKLIAEAQNDTGIFNYSTKRTQFAVPIKNIVYFESDMKYVIIHYYDGNEDRFFGKLRDIVEKIHADSLAARFVRIHKSFYVNADYLIKMDKASRTIVLRDHTVLPVSEARYVETIQWLENYQCPFGR